MNERIFQVVSNDLVVVADSVKAEVQRWRCSFGCMYSSETWIRLCVVVLGPSPAHVVPMTLLYSVVISRINL